MNTLRVLIKNPRRMLGALAALGLAVAVVAGSSASFTSRSANPGNTFAAGNLSHSNSKAGAAILTIDALKPGESSNGTVTITNNGDVGGTFTLAKANLADTPGPNGGVLSGKLDLVVQDVTNAESPVEVYSGKVDAMPSKALGTFAVSEARTYKFIVSFPDGGTPASDTTGDNAFKASEMSVEYVWSAV